MKELGEIITGNTPSKKTEEFWNSEDICFVKPDIIADNGVNEIVDSNEYISEDARKKARVVGKNSIFVTCIGSIGKIGIASDGEYAFNQQINAIIPNDRVQPKYLAYNLLFNKPRLVAIANAPVVPIINKSQFGEFTVNIETDIDRQREIVDVLDKLTQIIQQRNKEISALDDLIKARFVEMFGDPIINSKNKDTQDLKDVLVLKAGDFTAASDISEEPTETNIYPCYGGNGIRGYVADYNQEGEYSLVGRQGALSGNVQYAEGKFRNTEHALLVTPIIEMNSIWLNQLLINLDLKRYQTGAAQPGLSVKNLQEIPIIMVSIDEQNRYADFVHQVDKSKIAIQKSLDETQQLFDSLMQQYFG